MDMKETVAVMIEEEVELAIIVIGQAISQEIAGKTALEMGQEEADSEQEVVETVLATIATKKDIWPETAMQLTEEIEEEDRKNILFIPFHSFFQYFIVHECQKL